MSDTGYIIGASALILIGLFLAFEGRIFLAYGVETQAEVESHEEYVVRDDRTTRTRYRPIVRYSVGTESYTYTAKDGEGSPPRRGSTRTLYYRHSKPSSARLESELTGFGSRGAGAFLFIGFGLFLGYRGLPGFMSKYDLLGDKESPTPPTGDQKPPTPPAGDK